MYVYMSICICFTIQTNTDFLATSSANLDQKHLCLPRYLHSLSVANQIKWLNQKSVCKIGPGFLVEIILSESKKRFVWSANYWEEGEKKTILSCCSFPLCQSFFPSPCNQVHPGIPYLIQASKDARGNVSALITLPLFWLNHQWRPYSGPTCTRQDMAEGCTTPSNKYQTPSTKHNVSKIDTNVNYTLHPTPNTAMQIWNKPSRDHGQAISSCCICVDPPSESRHLHTNSFLQTHLKKHLQN